MDSGVDTTDTTPGPDRLSHDAGPIYVIEHNAAAVPPFAGWDGRSRWVDAHDRWTPAD
jgi:hypothetical protein